MARSGIVTGDFIQVSRCDRPASLTDVSESADRRPA